MRSRWLAAVLAVGLAGAAPAASQSLPETVFNDFRYGVSDILAVWTSPFRGSARDYATAGVAIGAVGLTALVDDDIGRWIRDHPEAGVLEVLKPFRERDSKPKLVDLGAGNSLVQVGGGLYLIGLIAGSQNLRDAGIGCIAAEKSNGIPRHYIYKGVHRERPLYEVATPTDTTERLGDAYDIEFPGDDEDWFDNSFFGGHGANIMACTSFLNHRFDLGYAEPLLWTVAIGVNLGRMADQRHWATDTLIGATVGFAIGKYVAERSLDRAAERNADANGEEGPDEAGPSLLEGVFIDRDAAGRTLIGWKRSF
ncbi:MAG: phosphatase PAP2 family protein [Longimicrobiales bacterium]